MLVPMTIGSAVSDATSAKLLEQRKCWRPSAGAAGSKCAWATAKPDVQQKGVTGNTVLFAQPTAEIPSMVLPPNRDGLAESLNVLYVQPARGTMGTGEA